MKNLRPTANNLEKYGSIQRILWYEYRRTPEIYLHGIGEMERETMARVEQARKVLIRKRGYKEKRVRCDLITILNFLG